MQTWLRLAVVAGILAPSGFAVDWNAYRPQGFVSDFADVIDARTKSELEDYCSRVERSAGMRISLVTIASLEGEPIQDVGPAVFRSWNRAAGSTDDHVMVILAVAERRDWIEIGSSIPTALSNGLQVRILREASPALQVANYGEAFKAAAETIGSAAARARNVPAPSPLTRGLRLTLSNSVPWMVIAGAAILLTYLLLAGAPRGYGGFSHGGLLTTLLSRDTMSRSTWGSRGNGGFGGYDSGDSSGGFGSGSCRDW